MRIIIEDFPNLDIPLVINDVENFVLITGTHDGTYSETIKSNHPFLCFSSAILERRVNDCIFQLTDQ